MRGANAGGLWPAILGAFTLLKDGNFLKLKAVREMSSVLELMQIHEPHSAIGLVKMTWQKIVASGNRTRRSCAARD